MSEILAVGIGVGLAAAAGVRAYIPVLVVGVFALIGTLALHRPFGVLDGGVALGALVVLALLEVGLDKAGRVSRVLDYVQFPVRMAAGAVLFAVALGVGVGQAAVPELVAGGVIAGIVAALKMVLRPVGGGTGVSAGFLSLCEDLTGLIGGVVSVFVPYIALALVAFLLFFYYRVKRRRERKYRGLRILGD
ncbi:MAG: DUF4126 domain-containing protein [Rubrobacteraceae bacterium]|uniref:DUF4126 domain-containing protein n=1 Tax=Rubrobacter naiadicus TaxID=1392641 RepID=UPI00235EEFC2|nr:DUF4126 domain-containing protein [Rubrobacter naiadicus]MBX6763160.1 DUF4126 domain-containing protein [Rubrobacteraceae bacterium]